MVSNNAPPDIVTWNSVLKGMFQNGKTKQAKLLISGLSTLSTQKMDDSNSNGGFMFANELKQWDQSIGRIRLPISLKMFIQKYKFLCQDLIAAHPLVPTLATHSVIIGGLKKMGYYDYLHEYRMAIKDQNVNFLLKISLDVSLLKSSVIRSQLKKSFECTKQLYSHLTKDDIPSKSSITINLLNGCINTGDVRMAFEITRRKSTINEFMILPLLLTLERYSQMNVDTRLNKIIPSIIMNIINPVNQLIYSKEKGFENSDSNLTIELPTNETQDLGIYNGLQKQNISANELGEFAFEISNLLLGINKSIHMDFYRLISTSPSHFASFLQIVKNWFGSEGLLEFMENFQEETQKNLPLNTTGLNIVLNSIVVHDPSLAFQLFTSFTSMNRNSLKSTNIPKDTLDSRILLFPDIVTMRVLLNGAMNVSDYDLAKKVAMSFASNYYINSKLLREKK
ncbi:hypothetical protein BB559_001015 [Furculomyces boomerangus]|uniref:Uncharacterized protein n=1 Tax=Furculomyces boomerangus TaxID=61424 RepID=A0A2T9Z3A6_9FUNG|nr:hypothetical protein BB559_001015 [Furculomyces boomerangus]